MKKLEWKRTIKYKIQNKIQERVEKEMENKTKVRTVIREDKLGRKEYIATCDRDLVKDNIKIRLHKWELKRNNPTQRRRGREMPHMQSKGRHNCFGQFAICF